MSITIQDLRAWKSEGRRFAMLTAYDYPTAKLLDEAGIPVLLVGDTLAQALSSRGIPVMGHLGLTPQSVHAMGGYRVQGRTDAAALKLVNDAAELEQAGAFAIVLEGVPMQLAAEITQKLSIPTIGIGA